MAKPKTPKKSGGSLSGMRSGMKRLAGTKSRKRKKPPTFNQVFGWVLGFALLVAIIFIFTR